MLKSLYHKIREIMRQYYDVSEIALTLSVDGITEEIYFIREPQAKAEAIDEDEDCEDKNT